MAYQAIVHGAGGVMWWGTNFISSGSPLWTAIKETTRELDQLKPWLVADDADVEVGAAGLQVLLKQPRSSSGQKLNLLIAVNPTDQPLSATLSPNGPWVFGTVREVFQGEDIAVASNSFTDEFGAYGVHVYEVDIVASR